MSRINEMYQKVYRTLKEVPESRDSDKRLIYEILTRDYGLTISFEEFDKFPSFESLTRARRKIQNDECLFIANENTQIAREEEQQTYKEAYCVADLW